MTGFVSCRFCGARVLSPAALTDHLDRCKRVNGRDRHVDTAPTIGGQPQPGAPTGVTRGAIEVNQRLSKAFAEALVDVPAGIVEMGRAAGIDTRTDPLGGVLMLATHGDKLPHFVKRARERRQS